MNFTSVLTCFASIFINVPCNLVPWGSSSVFGGLPAAARSTSSGYAVKTPPLDTPWTYEVGTNPWPQYPRPLLEREQWQTLNGVWRYEKASSLGSVRSPPFNKTLSEAVLVPSCLESGLSGIQGSEMLYNWYSTSFTVPSDWTAERVLLNFGAVDYEATVFVNGKKAGFHRGGYFAFTLDITEHLAPGSNELLIFVHDPTDSDNIPLGKQTFAPAHIWYTPCSGIWQSVWIESAPSAYITELNINADMHGNVSGTISTSTNTSETAAISISSRDANDDSEIVREVFANEAFSITIPSPKLWSPGSPNLYDIKITVGDDTISSYTGFRTISRGIIDGIQRPLLNGEFVFLAGTLDQGYWPDGIYTPPTKEAMVYDLQVLKKLGFNSLRKHVKIENDLFYQACDEIGLLVLQDMPSMLHYNVDPDRAQQSEFERQLELLIRQFRNYPSIAIWVIYNEGWGQITSPYHPEIELTDIVKKLDPTRLVIAASGWHDNGAGDFSDNHHYASPQCGTPYYSRRSSPYDPERIGIQGEFAGIGHNVSIDHLWNVQDAIDGIDRTYEIDMTLDAWRYRGHELLGQLQAQIENYACSGAIWTQTTDVEGEVNGMMTYDRRILRPDVERWKSDLQACYDAAARRSNSSVSPDFGQVLKEL